MSMTADKELVIVFGAMTDSIQKQLLAQQITRPRKIVQVLQMDADSITRLAIRGLLSDSEVRKARQRLMKKIKRTLEAK